MTVVRICHYPRRDGPLPDGARWVGRPSRWGNPYAARQEPDGVWSVVHKFRVGRRWHDYEMERTFRAFDTHFVAATEAVRSYALMLDNDMADLEADPAWYFADLVDATALACACPLGQPCHADLLVAYLDEIGHDQ